jgi:hypothetical protein
LTICCDQAFAHLTILSSDQQRRLRDVAANVVEPAIG